MVKLEEFNLADVITRPEFIKEYKWGIFAGLVKRVKGLEGMLSDPAIAFTVLALHDSALDRVNKNTRNQWEADPNGVLKRVINNHIFDGRISFGNILEGYRAVTERTLAHIRQDDGRIERDFSMKSRSNQSFTVGLSRRTMFLETGEGKANFQRVDISVKNGVIHVIDTALGLGPFV